MELVNGQLPCTMQLRLRFSIAIPLTGAPLGSIPRPEQHRAWPTTHLSLGGSSMLHLCTRSGHRRRHDDHCKRGCRMFVRRTGITSIGGGRLTLGCGNGNWYHRAPAPTGPSITSGKQSAWICWPKYYSHVPGNPAAWRCSAWASSRLGSGAPPQGERAAAVATAQTLAFSPCRCGLRARATEDDLQVRQDRT